jgi:hypothetical protein
MPFDTSLTGVAHAIQQSVAPVFLVSGIGAMLAVMTNRLARIVDRLRAMENAGDISNAAFMAEWRLLARRARLIRWSIVLCTATALLICTVIAVLFIGSFLQFDTSEFVALAFALAMIVFAVGLTLFLREVMAAVSSMSTEPKRTIRPAPSGQTAASGGPSKPSS